MIFGIKIYQIKTVCHVQSGQDDVSLTRMVAQPLLLFRVISLELFLYGKACELVS